MTFVEWLLSMTGAGIVLLAAGIVGFIGGEYDGYQRGYRAGKAE
jgi:hypothetical protein